MKAHRPKRGSHPPGTFWLYNNWDINALGTIYEQATKWSVFTGFDRLIALPLQMEDFDVAHDTRYFRDPSSLHPADMFRMSSRDMARFGLLYLRHGSGPVTSRLFQPAGLIRAYTPTRRSVRSADSGTFGRLR